MGPVLTVMVGIVLQVGGYLGIYLAAHHRFFIPYWAMLGLAVVACNGQTWFETASLVTCVRNFETERHALYSLRMKHNMFWSSELQLHPGPSNLGHACTTVPIDSPKM